MPSCLALAYTCVKGIITKGNGSAVTFGEKEPSDLLGISGHIKTYTEQIHEEETAKLQKAVEDAERLLFLGFAFHRQNLTLLSPKAGMKASVYATTLGISSSDEDVIRHQIRSRGCKSFEALPLECHALLQHFWRSLSQ